MFAESRSPESDSGSEYFLEFFSKNLNRICGCKRRKIRPGKDHPGHKIQVKHKLSIWQYLKLGFSRVYSMFEYKPKQVSTAETVGFIGFVVDGSERGGIR